MTELQASYWQTHMARVSTTDNVAECGLMLYNKPSATRWVEVTCDACLERKPAPIVHEVSRAPVHYRTGTGDLYSAFIAEYGLEIWCRHVEMECIQYLHRARKKGQYREDIDKVRVICERILAETTAEEMRSSVHEEET